MFFYKLGLLTCAFYVGLTIALESGIWAILRNRGLMYFLPKGKDMFWFMGVPFGILFGTLWLVSFSAAWWIVYRDLKPFLQQILK